MKHFVYSLLVFIGLLILSGCGGGGGGSAPVGFGTATSESNDGTTMNQVLMGPLKGAKVKIYKISDTNSLVEEIKTDDFGRFSVALDKIADDELLLVVASGGYDIDANDDGVLDATPTQNKGSIHAFATAKDLKAGKVNITFLSEIVYIYSEKYLDEIKAEKLASKDFKKMLDAIALRLLPEKDELLSFTPTDKNDTKKLKFDYTKLVVGDNNVASLYHEDANKSKRVEAVYSILKDLDLSIYDARLDSLKEKVKVSFVPSHITFSSNNIDISTTSTEAMVDKNTTFSISIDSVDDGYKIAKWNGCDKVSSDLKVCTVDKIKVDKIISPIAVPKEIKLATGIVIRDLSSSYVVIDTNATTKTQKVMTFYSDIKDKNTTELLSVMQIGDIIVHKTEPVFFGKLTEKNKINDFRYNVKIDNIPMEEILSSGYVTTSIDKVGTYGSASTSRVISRSLVLPNGESIAFDPNKPASITIRFDKNGDEVYQVNKRTLATISKKLGIAKIEGSITVTPVFDFDASWTFLGGLDQIYFSGGVVVEDNVKITTDEEWTFNKDINVSELSFTQIVMVGPLPIVLTEPIKIYVGADGKMEVKGELSASASISPTFTTAWSKLSGASADIGLHPIFTTSAEVNGEVKTFAYMGVYPSFQIYGVGAGIDNKFGPYFELAGTAKAEMTDFKGSKIALGLSGQYGLRYIGEFNLNSSWKFVDEALSKINKKISSTKLNKITKNWVYGNINESFEPEKIPGYIIVNGDKLLSETKVVGEDISIIKEYTLENKGETSVYWKASASATTPLDASLGSSGVSKLSGILKAGESITISLSVTSSGTDETSVGKHSASLYVYQSKVPFTPYFMKLPVFTANFIENIIQEKLDSLPTTALKIGVSGSTVKRMEFSWDLHDEYEEKLDGYYIYKSDYNESSKICEDFSTFMKVDGAKNTMAISGDLLSLSSISGLKSIKAGKSYCFLLTGYKGKREVKLSKPVTVLPLPITATEDTNTTSGELDIMFVVDVSGSYGDDIATFKTQSKDIIDSIRSSLPKETALKVGLTSFSDYASTSGYSSDYAYRLDQNLTTKTDDFRAALDRLKLLNGGDWAESQLEAMYQTISSKAIGWNKDAIKFVFLFTDAGFHDSDKESSYKGHGFTSVKEVIKANNISVIGFGSGSIPSDLKNISDWTFRLSSSSAEVVEKIKTIIGAIPGSKVSLRSRKFTQPIEDDYIYTTSGPSNNESKY